MISRKVNPRIEKKHICLFIKVKTLEKMANKHHIEANYDRKVTISDIAKQIGLDRAYFTKLFREQVKSSPYKFILDYRLEKSIRMLIHTRESVQTIAKSVGFDDPVYFAKVFKQRKGFSPSSFRKNYPDQRVLKIRRSDEHHL